MRRRSTEIDRLNDAIECIEKVQTYLNGYTFQQFKTDEKLVDAVLRNMEILGEATHKLSSSTKSMYNSIDWKALYTMRNVVAHSYFRVSLWIIWNTYSNDLPNIKTELTKILADKTEEINKR